MVICRVGSTPCSILSQKYFGVIESICEDVFRDIFANVNCHPESCSVQHAVADTSSDAVHNFNETKLR